MFLSNTTSLCRNCLAQPKNRLCRPQTHLIRCAMDASFGDAMNNQSGNAMNNQSGNACPFELFSWLSG